MRHRFEAKDRVFQAEMPASLDRRKEMVRTILDQLPRYGCEVDEFTDGLCIDEALVNAIVHGNREDPEKSVLVRLLVSKDRWGVEITDEGEGFDWQPVVNRRPQDLDPEAATGRGVALIVASGMDVEYSDGGRTVLLSRPIERQTDGA